ncbi:hydroxyethylthiazole kinase [Lentilactobacillus kribbianus]|uniref:hydroxyethylthiazole kinase n=1 Tax=Lentilactobacillus kribbianus TaxID=2729622 RepID=UPI0015531DD1|nr:hydroxyethylthiazole kinase [Lentilactobacillus kribbianus]
MKINLLNQVKQQNPLAFNLANNVTIQDVANGINAIGGSPIMSSEVVEAKDMVAMADSVTINLGTITEMQFEQMQVVGRVANELDKPLILDPVAVAVPYRFKHCQELLAELQFAVIRGNAGEIAALAGEKWQAKGIDAGDGDGDLVAIAKRLANKQHCVVVVSGAVDIVTDGQLVTKIYNQTDLFKLHVGSGDMLSSTIGVFAGVTANYYEAAQAASLVFAVAGQVVAEQMKQPLAGSFGAQLIDELYLLTEATVAEKSKYEEDENGK